MERRVVITAASAITPIGHGKKDIVDSLLQGRSGVISLRDDHLLSGYIDCKVYGTINYPLDFDFERKYRKTMGPVSYYACQVVKEVLESSGLEKAFISSGNLGVAFGSTHGSPTVQREITRISSAARKTGSPPSAQWITSNPWSTPPRSTLPRCLKSPAG